MELMPEERAAQRFAREQERRAKGKSLFDLEASDEENPGFGDALTHGGRRIDELASDDSDEVNGEGDSDDVGGMLKRKRKYGEEEYGAGADRNQDGEEQPDYKKSKKEVMQEVISKSKLHKYERRCKTKKQINTIFTIRKSSFHYLQTPSQDWKQGKHLHGKQDQGKDSKVFL